MVGSECLRVFVAERYDGSRAAFARDADVPAPMVCLWISGKRKPGRTNALKVELASEGRVPANSWDSVEVRRHVPSRSSPRSRAVPRVKTQHG